MRTPVHVGGYQPRAATWWVVALTGLAVLTWLLAPFVWSETKPNPDSAAAESGQVMVCLVALLGLLCVLIWRDSGRSFRPLGVMTAAALANALFASSFTDAAGVDVGLGLPLVVGMAIGGPAGVFTGASSSLLATLMSGEGFTNQPMGVLVWGAAGLVGGMLRPATARVAAAVAVPLAMAYGFAVGLCINAMTWTAADPQSSLSFKEGAPIFANLSTLVLFGSETTQGTDVLRGFFAAAVILVCGYPMCVALRHDLRPEVAETRPEPLAALSTDQLITDRRERSRRIPHMWERKQQ